MTGWTRATIGGSCTVFSGGTPSKGNASYWRGPIPWVSAKDLKADRIFDAELHISQQACDESAAKMAPTGSLLMLVRGMGLANGIQIGEVTSPVAFNQDLRAIVPPKTVDSRFLLLALRHCLADGGAGVLSSAAHGTLKIDADALRRVEFPVPPMQEQRRIVAILDEAFEAIATAKANAEKNLQNARQVFESHLAAVFSARNEGWTDRKLHSICRRITVGHVGSMANLYKPAGIPFLRSQNIRPFSVSMQNLVFIDEEFHATLGKSSLQAGDVAIVRTGYPGTAAVVPDSLGVANCSDLVIVRPGPEIDAHFLAAFFNSAFGKSMVSGKVVGAAQKHFNVGAAKDVVLHLPPLVEQQSIVAATNDLRDETNRLESLYARKLSALDELKKSLLHQAFTGKF